MEKQNKKTSNRGKQNKIFISWSGDKSKKFAKELKNVLENIIFKDTGLTCFVSDIDIASGSDWWLKIKNELNKCKLGILCITKENITAPWIYYEAGALTARNVPTIPLLISCNVNSIKDSPLQGKQCTDFYDQQKFVKMIKDINEEMSIYSITEDTLEIIARSGYEKLKTNAESILKELKDRRIFNTKYVYPSDIKTIKTNTIFISAPMASIDSSEYDDLRKYVLTLKNILTDIGSEHTQERFSLSCASISCVPARILPCHFSGISLR